MIYISLTDPFLFILYITCFFGSMWCLWYFLLVASIFLYFCPKFGSYNTLFARNSSFNVSLSQFTTIGTKKIIFLKIIFSKYLYISKSIKKILQNITFCDQLCIHTNELNNIEDIIKKYGQNHFGSTFLASRK